ncbi:hypothetical protein GCM10027449_14750 [Sinomonas notoginsengisoli]
MALPARHIYAQLVHHGAVTDWASGRTLDIPGSTSSPEGVRRASRTAYGTPISEVDEHLRHAITPQSDATAGTTKRRRSQP